MHIAAFLMGRPAEDYAFHTLQRLGCSAVEDCVLLAQWGCTVAEGCEVPVSVLVLG